MKVRIERGKQERVELKEVIILLVLLFEQGDQYSVIPLRHYRLPKKKGV